MNISLVSNIICAPFFSKSIQDCFLARKVKTNSVYIHFDSYTDTTYAKQMATSDVVILLLNFDYLYPNYYTDLFSKKITEKQIIEHTTALCHTVYTKLRSFIQSPLYWFSFEDYYQECFRVQGNTHIFEDVVYEINRSVGAFLVEDDILINTKRLIADIGIQNTYSAKNKYRWNAPYTQKMIVKIAEEVYKQYLICRRITRKCLVLDCDNVLWGGILSEDGIENIKLADFGLGRAYKDFQRFVLSLYYHGVIIAVCSKNDLADVMNMFHMHSEMILQEEHIACFQVNWENKAENITHIAQVLNINLDSIVFVDDSPHEIEMVSTLLPEVRSILYNPETIYEKLSCFNVQKVQNSEDIQKRIKTYQANQSRRILKAHYASDEQYLNALGMNIDIHKALPSELNRISELTQRTTRCTNGVRYTVSHIKERLNMNRVSFYSLSLSDRFSDLGLVGTFAVENTTLTLFSVSCRALGRKLEDAMISFIKENHHINKIDFYSTGKNENIEKLLAKNFPHSMAKNRYNMQEN